MSFLTRQKRNVFEIRQNCFLERAGVTPGLPGNGFLDSDRGAVLRDSGSKNVNVNWSKKHERSFL